MRKVELRKLVEEYRILKSKSNGNDPKTLENLKELERRYFHETGQELSLP